MVNMKNGNHFKDVTKSNYQLMLTDSEQKSEETIIKSSGNVRTKHIPWITIFGYAAPMIGAGGMNFTLTTFTAYFYTDILGLPPGIVGYVQLTLMIMYAISEPIFGSISDSTRSTFAKNFGRRKPYLIFSAILHAVTFYCLVAPPSWLNASNGLKEWAFIFAFVLGASWGCNEVTYQALGAQLTFDYDERTKLQAVTVAVITTGSTSCCLIHGILGSVLGASVDANRLRFMILAIAYSSVFLLGTFILLVLVKEDAVEIQDDIYSNVSFINWLQVGWGSVKEMFYNVPFFLLTVSYSCTILAGAVTPMMLPYFTKNVVQTEFSSNWAPLLFTASAIGGMPLWVLLGGPHVRMEKKWKHLAAAGWLSVCLILTATLIRKHDNITFTIFSICGGFAMGGYFATPEAMKPDVVDYDEFRTGARHEARFAGVFMFFANMSAGIGLELMLLTLELCQYDGTKTMEEVQPNSATLAIKIGYGATLPLMTLLMFFSMIFYPISRNKHAIILEATQKRLGGEYVADPLYGGDPLPPYDNIPITVPISPTSIDRGNPETFIQQVRMEVGPLASLHGDRSSMRTVT